MLCLASTLDELITATSVVIVVIYLLVATSALVSRVRDRTRPASAFRMPLWPVPPVVAIVGAVLALVEQSIVDLVVALGIALVAAVVFWLVRRRLPPRPVPG